MTLLREEVAKYTGPGLSVESVLCCVPQEGILLLHALLEKGDEIVVTAPGYQSLRA
jgi:DNA-binding transcriptional MocR family regulator